MAGENEQQMSSFKCCILSLRSVPVVWSNCSMPSCENLAPSRRPPTICHLSGHTKTNLAQINTESLLAALPQSPRNIPMGNNPMGPPDGLDP